jgi:hypothetical protein
MLFQFEKSCVKRGARISSFSFLAAPIAQLDRAADYGSAGYRFNSYWVHH